MIDLIRRWFAATPRQDTSLLAGETDEAPALESCLRAYRAGTAHVERGEWRLAESELTQAIALKHDFGQAHYHLGRVYLHLGRTEDAVDCLVLATHFRPTCAAAWYSLALAVKGNDSLHAVRCLEQALQLRPEYAEAHNELGVVALEQGDEKRAIDSFKKALAVNPRYARAHSNLGCILYRDCGEYERGAEHIRIAVTLDPHDLSAQCNHSMVLLHQGRLDECVAVCDQLLAAEAGLDEARLNRALAMLKLGIFARAWPEYEARKRIPGNYTARAIEFPAWNGASLEGKSLLVFAEQGIGDEVMFASCVPDVLALGGHCVIECAPQLERLFRRSFPGAVVHGVRQGNADSRWMTDVGSIDYQVDIGSLPGYFRREAADFPRHAGYLRADAVRVAAWRARLDALGPERKIGISWRGGTLRTRRSTRSIPLHEWMPLLRQATCRFVSLQYGECGEELAAVRQSCGVEVHEWREAIDDYDETAALVSALDLVISVQTAVVHLAGALGKRAWVLVPVAPEWRYLESGETMPWYPSVRLFRQLQAGQWQEAIAQVTAALAQSTRR